MKVLMVTSEAAPFVKTGGLADVLGALPPALAQLGEEVAVVLPKHRSAQVAGAERVWLDMPLWAGTNGYTAAIDQVVHEGVRYFFVDCPPLYDRAEVYGDYPDNHIRFALLDQAAIGVARGIFRPNIFHGHDWQCGLLGAYLRTTLAGDPTFIGTRLIFTIHNLGYQGLFPAEAATDLGLGTDVYHPEGLEFWGQVNFMKGGLAWNDAITTVSPTYAREIQTPEFGFGLDGFLRARADRLTGILNGVDYRVWDPATDPELASNFSPADLSGKKRSKLDLLQQFGLPGDEAAMARPLIGIVSRLATQKGFDLVGEIAPWLATRDLSMVVLGSGEPEIEQMFRELAASQPDKVSVRLEYNNRLAHRIEAGSDMFLMPSRYEPCGLNQIYSLRYGSVPIVRATGGLDDTVDEETGFKFKEYSAAALTGAILEALEAFENPEGWKRRVLAGMAKDFSWGASAAAYQRLYNNLR